MNTSDRQKYRSYHSSGPVSVIDLVTGIQYEADKAYFGPVYCEFVGGRELMSLSKDHLYKVSFTDVDSVSVSETMRLLARETYTPGSVTCRGIPPNNLEMAVAMARKYRRIK